MDNTLNTRNVSDLEKALNSISLQQQPNIEQNFENINSDTTQQFNALQRMMENQQQIQSQPKQSVSAKPRTTAQANSTAGLLSNLNGLQTQCNTKLDILNESLMRLTNTMIEITKNQEKQNELLATMSMNLLKLQMPQLSTGGTGSSSPKSFQAPLKDYSFVSSTSVMSELIMRLIQLCKRQIIDKHKQYMSSRDITISVLNSTIKTVCTKEVKIGSRTHDALVMPGTKSPAVIHIASRIGAVHGISPVMTTVSFRNLLDDPECSTFVTLMNDVIERLRTFRYLIPYYEADILCAIQYPYFDKEGSMICDWSKINPRKETADEALVQNAPVKKRESIGAFLVKGASIKSAINAVLREK